MIKNLALAKQALIDQVKIVANHHDFLTKIKSIDAKVIDGKLYWGLGRNPGYVVIDTVENKVYRVFELTEALSDNSLCSPEMALLVLYDIQDFI